MIMSNDTMIQIMLRQLMQINSCSTCATKLLMIIVNEFCIINRTKMFYNIAVIAVFSVIVNGKYIMFVNNTKDKVSQKNVLYQKCHYVQSGF
jgi:hypothetical protein